MALQAFSQFFSIVVLPPALKNERCGRIRHEKRAIGAIAAT